MRLLKLAQRSAYALFYAVDLVGSALTLGGPGETISARLGKAAVQDPSCVAAAFAHDLDWLVKAVFGAPNHCAGALAAYNARESVSPFGE
jgi:hypothetical protein